MARRTRAGGARKRPVRYTDETTADLAAALRAHRKGAWADAAAGYRAVLARDARQLDAWVNLGAVLVRLGHAREARDAYANACRATGDARVHRDAGIGLAAVGLFAPARAALERAAAADATAVGARLALARVCGETGDLDAARAHATEATRIAPDEPSPWLELHHAFFDDRAPGPCIDAARRAVAVDPHYAHARVALAGALAWDGQRPGALAALGDDGVVASALHDTIAYAADHRGPATRAFAYARETRLDALDHVTQTGPWLEFGVRHGISTRTLAERGAIEAFDSFEGLPLPWQGRDVGAFSTAGELPEVPPDVRLHVGRFEDTLPAFVTTMNESPAFLHVDSDLYESARTVFAYLGPTLRDGCIVVFDEYFGNAHWRDDEFRAFAEAREHHGWRYDYLALSWLTGQATVRIRRP